MVAHLEEVMALSMIMVIHLMVGVAHLRLVMTHWVVGVAHSTKEVAQLQGVVSWEEHWEVVMCHG
jgi:hypothetical protein